MNAIAFTSELATFNIASRTTREVGQSALVPILAIADVILPMAKMLAARGKISRAELREQFRIMVHRLHHTENVVQVDVGRMTSSTRGLSANESFDVRCITMAGAGKDSITFMACDIGITRHKMVLFFNTSEFCMSPHLLARYMQRGRRELASFLSQALRPMRLATMLTPNEVDDGSPVALPIDGGLLLGRAFIVEADRYPIQISYSKDGVSRDDGEERRGLSSRILTDMRTFIHQDSLTGRKLAMLAALEAWEREHVEGITYWYEATMFGAARLTFGADGVGLKASVKAARDACRDLVSSPLWRDPKDTGQK